jgi:hypothetical protein
MPNLERFEAQGRKFQADDLLSAREVSLAICHLRLEAT